MLSNMRIILLSIILCLIFSSSCLADDTSLGRTPEGVYPINNNDIEMTDELVNIYIKEGKVDCTFTFTNTGGESTVLMGFPATLDEGYVRQAPGEEEDSLIRNFTAFDGQKKLLVKLENEVEVDLEDYNKRWYDKWYTFEVNFKAGETKTIKNTYEFKAPVCSVGPGQVLTGYVLDTGAAWKGNIGHAEVVFHLEDIAFTRIESFYPLDITALTLEEDKLIFEKSDFEPNFNLELCYWSDPGNLDEDDSFYEYLNYLRHMRLKRFFDLTEAGNKDKIFEEAVIKGNSFEILYLLNKINIPKYRSAAPEAGEILISNDRALDMSVVDFSGNLKSVKYEIYSLEDPNILLYEEAKDIEKNSIEGFGVKNSISPSIYKDKASIKLRISAVDYDNNTMGYGADIKFDEGFDELEKISKKSKSDSSNKDSIEETSSNNKETKEKADGSSSEEGQNSKAIMLIMIGLLLMLCIIQQIRIYRLKK